MRLKEIRPCVYVTESRGFIDLYRFKDSAIYSKLFATVTERCHSFIQTQDLKRFDVTKISGSCYIIPADCSAELVIKIIELNAMSDCSVCIHRDDYCGCKHHEYGQNWSFGAVGDCEGFTLEHKAWSAPSVKEECSGEFKKFLKMRKDVHDCMVQTGTNWGGEPVFRGIFGGKMYRGVFDHVYYKILSLMVEKEMMETV